MRFNDEMSKTFFCGLHEINQILPITPNFVSHNSKIPDFEVRLAIERMIWLTFEDENLFDVLSVVTWVFIFGRFL